VAQYSDSAEARLRVLVVSDMFGFPGSASGSFIHRQIRELSNQDVETRVLIPRPRLVRVGRFGLDPVALRGVDRGSESIYGVPVQDVPHWNTPVYRFPLLAERLLGSALRRAVRKVGTEWPFHLLHCHRLFPGGAASIRAARDVGVPVILSARGSDVHTHPERNDRLRRATIRALRSAEAVTAVSGELAKATERLAADGRRVVVVRNGVDLDQFSPPERPSADRAILGLPARGPGICVLGRLHPIKGVVEVAAAFSLLAAEHSDAWIALVGDGPLRKELELWRAESGFADRIFLPGGVPHDRIPAWLRASNLLALASHNEGLPNAVLEAMACGLPVVATRVGGVPEVVEHGVTGLLVETGRVEDLAHSIGMLLADVEVRKAMGEAARRHVAEHFSWSASAKRLADLYRTVLSRPNTGTISA
jgi:teichuronic acid biosynthesis glycosyltransferase TuaC